MNVLFRWDLQSQGPFTETALRHKFVCMGYSVLRYEYPPGTVFHNHAHAVDKIDGVVSGRFEMSMEGYTVILEPGDYLLVPKGIVHSAKVVGDQPVISLDGSKIPERAPV